MHQTTAILFHRAVVASPSSHLPEGLSPSADLQACGLVGGHDVVKSVVKYVTEGSIIAL